MVLALNVSVYFCKLLPLHMNGNLPVGIGMHVFAMICDLIHFSVDRCSAIIYVFHACLCVLSTVASQVPGTQDRAGLIASSGSFFSMV
eukprot:UN0398